MDTRENNFQSNSKGKNRIVLVIILMLFMQTVTKATTLEQLLSRENIKYNQDVIKNLEKEISGYQILNEPNYFCAAYYLNDDPDLRNEKFCVALLDKDQDKWIQRDIEFKEILLDKPFLRPNSIQKINYSKNYFYIDTHINPSSGYLVILHKDLSFADAIYGWLEAVFTEDSIIYHNSQVHFAPTHYAELSLYNISTKVNQKIYPMKPYQQVRLNHISKVKAAYEKKGQDWFMAHNHHMDAELFNNFISGDVISNSKTRSFAYVVKYVNTDYMSDEDVLKLNGFREAKRVLKSNQIDSFIADACFMDIYSDLMRAKRTNIQDSIIGLFKDDAELKTMITAVLKSEDVRFGMNWKPYMISLDPNWDNLENWKKLAQIIQTKDNKYTEVLYIYRQVNETGKIEYKELLLKDAKRIYGDITLSNYLEPDLLKSIVDN